MVTVSECTTGGDVTLSIQGFWADQGTSVNNGYTADYTNPAGFSDGTYTTSGNCAGEARSTQFSVPFVAVEIFLKHFDRLNLKAKK